ncbi:hypothetical protein [Methylophaga thalassica]|uniref:hypothetical protein n=1 Tax=Methylophaga aminisulfidivorans TaxID=230105 RepID=UPI003A8F38DD
MNTLNLIKNRLHLAGVFCVLTLLIGCAPAYDRVGPQVELVPVEYHLDLDVGNEKLFWQELNRFIEHHKQIVLTQPITLSAANDMGNKLARKVEGKLLALGVTRNQISRQLNQVLEGDFQIKVKQYIAKTEECPYQIGSPFHNAISGCNVEHNRWISMVNPEDGVLNN